MEKKQREKEREVLAVLTLIMLGIAAACALYEAAIQTWGPFPWN